MTAGGDTRSYVRPVASAVSDVLKGLAQCLID